MTVTSELTHRGQPHSSLTLEDRFEVLKEIGDGSFGSVVLARVRTAGANVARRGSVVAIKSMKKTFDSLQPCLELREVVFLRTIPPHPHLVPALDIFLDPYSKKLHICMEYMEGNLYQLMKARDHKCLDNTSVKSILLQIMHGLEHIHAHQFFHRDIKPENILVSTSSHQESSNSFRRYSALVTPPSTPPQYTVKLADFGLARETHSKLPYTTYVSTRWYRAPEVLLRAGEYSAPVDIWAVGAMAVEIATLKPLFPGGNEVDQVWRVCEIMGSPGNWHNKSGQRVGGGDWREGNRLASKLGFSFPKMAPHAIDTILQAPQWPASLAHFVTWCLMWDPKARPTSTQALAHEYFADGVDPLRPRSAASKILGRKQSDLGRPAKESSSGTTSSRSSWFRKSLIGRSEAPETVAARELGPRPAVVHAASANDLKSRTTKRSTWTNGLSTVAPMPILPSIRPISPLSDAVTARGNNGPADAPPPVGISQEKKKLGRQLSVASSTNNYNTEMHRQQAERALNGQSGLASPPSGQKESFFSHLRKRARRFSGRHQTPVSPAFEEMEAQVGCGPWNSNRSSLVVDQSGAPKPEVYESLDRALQHPQNGAAPVPPMHQASSASKLKRHHSLPQQQPRSVDNLIGAARGGPISSRTRRSQATHGVHQYEAPAEEDELLDEVLNSTQHAMNRLDGTNRKPLRQSISNIGLTSQPYPSPSPSANGSQILFADGTDAMTPRPLDLGKKHNSQYKWPTPPYEGGEWNSSSSNNLWAAGHRV
ncbi:serine/threonine-protein kinase MAK [Akanthomyces lecanii RCEF 1005]|uniref:Serine/threonine-protein kinase MAK n=1 Tax=Akanthomyces lecanii RCEF 1005 TaxID=1081108 RepID=A0A168HPH5_CORDF|nr:serine/threonine-protein kinase MAK [Akanthomyces lecanii RCEF 1005]